MSLHSLFIDFNSYFASVEQQTRPELRGQPVAVVPVMAETTCCIAVSQEAKQRGVHGGMRVAVARRACAGLKVIEARPPLYVAFHKKLKEIIDACVPVEKVDSIDEMRCVLTRKWQQREHAIALARQIKKAIAEKAGEHLRCSIGIAPNWFLAKAGSDMQKPDGLVVIEKHELPQRLFSLELQDLCGIGRRMEKRLRHAGINTVEQFCAAPRGQLRKIWGGVEGERMFDALRGETLWRPPTQRCMVGHSHVLAPAQRDEKIAHAVLHRLLQKAALRLRGMGHFARGLQMFVEHSSVGGFSAETTFLETQDTLELSHALSQLWERRPPRSEPLLMVGVALFDLVDEKNYTPSLFTRNRGSKHRQLTAAMDQINRRLGKNAAYFAASHLAADSAPMRIAFNFVPEQEFGSGSSEARAPERVAPYSVSQSWDQ